MPTYEVTIEHTLTETASISIEADNEDEANEKADQLAKTLDTEMGIEEYQKHEWQRDSESFEATEVSESS